MMILIFAFSSTPKNELPSFGLVDTLVKKGGHIIGYALLALTYWFGMGWDKKRGWLAWLLAVLYAATDEFHQSFVAGRNPSPVDVLLFDNLGAIIGLLLWTRFGKVKQTS